MVYFIDNSKIKVYYSYDLKSKNNTSILALDEALLKYVNKNKLPSIYFWTLDKTIILGTPDILIPNFKHSLKYLNNKGYSVLIRHTGGLAVVANEGILNFSLFLPLNPNKEFSFNEGYELMKKIIILSFPEAENKIQSFKIKNSYCPGDYDLSINNKKFAGIAQRRIKNGLVISMYISVFGNQLDRCNLIKNFYKLGNADKRNFPNISNNCMDNISNLINIDLSINDVKNRILETFYNLEYKIVKGYFSIELQLEYNKSFKNIEKQNSNILNI